METLIIILIVTMIAQTVLFVYSNFIDLSNRRQSRDVQEVMKNQHADFLNEKQRYEFLNDELQKRVNRLLRQRDGLFAQVQMLKKVIGRTKENPAFMQELTEQVADLVADYMERGVEFSAGHSLDLDFDIETDTKTYHVLLQVTENDKQEEDGSV